MRFLQSTFALVAAFILSSIPAAAQWSSNAGVNLPIANLAGDQAVPKLAARADGGCYLAWFDHAGSNYDVYLQRLDQNGYEMWPHNGIPISTNPQNTSLVDWDLITDSLGNAVLVFTDIRGGGDLDVYAYQIDPAGNFLWGPNGVALSTDTDFEANPVVAEMTDGSFVFAWSRSPTGVTARINMQKLDITGAPQFGGAPIEMLGGPTDDLGFVGIVSAPGGAFILSWIRDITPFTAPRHLHTWKFDAVGAPLWSPFPIAVYDAAALPIAYKPEMQSDGLGGAFYAWFASVGSFFQGRVQHVDATGLEVFPHNGVEISLEAARSELYPSMAQLGGDLIVFYAKEDSGQTMWGIGGQRISATGQPLWGASGISYVAYDATVEEAPRAVPAPNGAMCFVEHGNFGTTLLGFRVDGSGNTLWTPSPLTACSVVSTKDKLRAVAASDGTAILAWNDTRSGGNDVYAQNVELDGSLGVPPALAAPYGCGWNEPNTLVVVSGAPAIGTTFTVGVNDPSGSMPTGSLSLLAVSFFPAPGYPCGILAGSTAMAVPGGIGELLVDLGSPIIPIITGAAWTGPGSPSPFVFALPFFPPAVGITIYFQGALFHAASGRVGLSNAMSVRIGP